MLTDAILNQSEPNVILTAHLTKVNRTEPNWTEPQTCLAGRNHAFMALYAYWSIRLWLGIKGVLARRRVEFWPFPLTCFVAFTTLSHYHASVWYRKFLRSLVLQVKLVILASAFMAGSTFWWVSLFAPRCPPCPAICKSGSTFPRALRVSTTVTY